MDIDWTSSKVWMLFGGLGVGCVLIITTVLLGILYGFKLIISKSKLFDDHYIETSMRRVRRLRKISFSVLVVQIVIAALMRVLYLLKIITPQFTNWTLAYIIILFLAISFGAGPFLVRRLGLKRFLNAEDVQRVINQKRQLHK